MGVSIRDLAKRCGLSVSAVSKALNNYSDVSEKTRQFVTQAAREMGYFPNALARGLKTNRTFNLGVILDANMQDGLLHNFFIVILNGFRRAAERRGYDITLISRAVGEENMSYTDHCRYRTVDGVCLMCVDFFDSEVEALAESGIPLVAIDHIFDGKECVLSDNHQGMRTLTEYVLDRGHTRIAVLHGNLSRVTRQRLEAFQAALLARGIDIPQEYVVETDYHSTSSTYQAVRKLVALPVRPECIMMPDDYSALGGMDAIYEAGLRIPQDISVAGYDGISLIQKMHPRLTTLWQNGEEMGRLAAMRLIDRIEHPDAPLTPPDVVPGELLPGETVGIV